MSEHNPYEPSAPAKRPVEAPSPTLDLDPTTGPELPRDLPPAPDSGEGVPTGSIREIMDWVGKSKTRAKSAKRVEESRDDTRPSLVNRLEKVIKA